MKNQEIAKIFNEIADLLELKGENPFRIRAYRRAALNIEGLTKNIEEISHEEIMNIPGIGQDLGGKVEEYIRTGKILAYEKLTEEIPGGLSTLLSIPGLGPKTSRLLYENLRITNIEELEKFASEHKLAGLPGIK
ncbi:MAG TPA: helix-hairpin-helix domain-containing protein, partial [Dissulfurispiraceae bacterium]|nr:helix-hairpin-helix domain-containing protein [Dissulfurispiraceae bacterium]